MNTASDSTAIAAPTRAVPVAGCCTGATALMRPLSTSVMTCPHL